jgi:alcohol dehydrogenase class IV
MDSFVYNGSASKVVFGQGKISTLPDIVQSMQLERCIVLTTPDQRHLGQKVADLLGSKAVAIFDQATMHTPLDVTERAIEVASKAQVDSTVSIGGGSSTGLGKAISIRLGLRQICIPTTYAGSEMTPTLGETMNGRKTTRRDEAIRPDAVIYDVDLTLSLPVKMSSASGVNAIAHAGKKDQSEMACALLIVPVIVESLYSNDTNPIIRTFASEGIRNLATALLEIQKDPKSLSARSRAQYGAWLCAICLGSTKMGLHHKICHAIGGALNLPHAGTHTVVLPRALAYNAPAVPQAMKIIGEALPFGDGDAIKGLDMLVEALSLPSSLAEYGMQAWDIGQVATQVMQSGYENPVPLEAVGIHRLIYSCYMGRKERLQHL